MNIRTRIYGITRYIAFNGAFATALYYGFVLGMDGPANIAKFVMWLMLVVALLMCIPAVVEHVAKTQDNFDRSVPKYIDWMYDALVVAFLIYNGEFFYGSLYMVHTLILNTMVAVSRMLREKMVMDALTE